MAASSPCVSGRTPSHGGSWLASWLCFGLLACGEGGSTLEHPEHDHRHASSDSGVSDPESSPTNDTKDPARKSSAGAANVQGAAGSSAAKGASPRNAQDPPDASAGTERPADGNPPEQSSAAVGASDAGAGDDTAPEVPPASTFVWQLPTGFPLPVVPVDNPMNEAKIELGRRLFYDKRLSNNETQACASCHKQALAFTDGRATALGSTGKPHSRGAQSIVNLAYATSLTWANPLFAIGVLSEPLERQAQIPMYGDSPVELGLKSQAQLLGRLQEIELYREAFAEAFPIEDEPVNAQNVGRALAAFERTIVSGDSRYDHFMQGEDSALTESERRGYALFTSDKLECFSCHSGFNLTEHVQWEGKTPIELVYRNTGLYNIDGMGAYPEPNTGVFNVTMNPDDMGKFRVPTLRNIAVTAPYMHDGTITTLSEVIDHYAAGGRTIADGPNAGVGRDNPLKDSRIHGFEIAEADRLDLIAFLESLTDESLLANPAFADPWSSQ